MSARATGPGRTTALVALATGAVVLLLLVAERAGAGPDLLDLTVGGLVAAVLCGLAVGLLTGADRRLAAAGLGLAVLPSLVLAYELVVRGDA